MMQWYYVINYKCKIILLRYIIKLLTIMTLIFYIVLYFTLANVCPKIVMLWNIQSRAKKQCPMQQKLFSSLFYSSPLPATLAENKDHYTRSSHLSTRYSNSPQMNCSEFRAAKFQRRCLQEFPNPQSTARCQAVNYFCCDRLLCFYFWYFGCAKPQKAQRKSRSLAPGALYWKAINARRPQCHKYVRAPCEQLKGSLYHLQHS